MSGFHRAQHLLNVSESMYFSSYYGSEMKCRIRFYTGLNPSASVVSFRFLMSCISKSDTKVVRTLLFRFQLLFKPTILSIGYHLSIGDLPITLFESSFPFDRQSLVHHVLGEHPAKRWVSERRERRRDADEGMGDRGLQEVEKGEGTNRGTERNRGNERGVPR